MDADVLKALEASHLHSVTPDSLHKLLAGAQRVDVPARTVTHREGDSKPHLELIVAGVVKVFVRSQDGRTMTIRYCRSGSLLGAVSLYAADFSLPASLQTLTSTKLLRLSPETVRRMVHEDPNVAEAVIEELSERVLTFIYEIPDGAFATVRQRMARHLLDLASDWAPEQVRPGTDADAELVVRASQGDLAEAVGTAREVVVRILRELRHEGIVRTDRTGIVIVDPARLVQETRWNKSS
jgi:CRP/FNR family transcriptional regulator